MSPSPVRFKIFSGDVEVVAVEDHSPTCRAIQSVEDGYRDHPWYFHGKLWMDRRAGMRGMTTEWIELMCGDSRCPAWIRLNYKQLITLLLDHVEGRK